MFFILPADAAPGPEILAKGELVFVRVADRGPVVEDDVVGVRMSPPAVPMSTLREALTDVRLFTRGGEYRFSSVRDRSTKEQEDLLDSVLRVPLDPEEDVRVSDSVRLPSSEEVASEFEGDGAMLWEPMYWLSETCVNNPWPEPDIKILTWNLDDRNLVTAATLAGRKSGTLLIVRSNYNEILGSCSVSKISPSWGLTAAHCVANSNGTAYPESMFDVAAGGGANANDASYYTNFDGWTGVESIVVPSSYSGGNYSHDWALVEFTSPIPASVAVEYRFSGASNSSWYGSRPRHHGYPGYAKDCVANIEDTVVSYPLADYRSRRGRLITHPGAPGEVIAITNKLIGTRVDSSPGQSGGGIYRCGGGTCQNGETAWLMGVLAGRYWNGSFRHGGPHVRNIAPIANLLTD